VAGQLSAGFDIVEVVDGPLAAEIDRVAQEIERLKKDGDPENRIQDLNAYLRVLGRQLSEALQKDYSGDA
jgi:hypothetical protein